MQDIIGLSLFLGKYQNVPEGLSHWAHTEDDVQVVPDSLYQVAEQGVRRLHHVVFPGRL